VTESPITILLKSVRDLRNVSHTAITIQHSYRRILADQHASTFYREIQNLVGEDNAVLVLHPLSVSRTPFLTAIKKLNRLIRT